MKLYSRLAAMTLALGLVAGQQAWAECESCLNPATTDNGKFTIELLDTDTEDQLVTFIYEVCKTGSGPDNPDLSHWIFVPGIDCYGTFTDENGDLQSYTLADLIVGATWNGDPIELKIGLDPTTGLDGIKFDDLAGDDCHIFTITFDTSKLEEDQTLGAGCVQAATKAGQQTGYACILGPVCTDRPSEDDECWADETAWGAGTRYVAKGNWATYSAYVPDSTVILYAGQDYEAGTVYFSAPDGDGNITITVELADGFKFADVEENLKIQGYEVAPDGNPDVGSFEHKFDVDPDASSFTTGPIPLANFYGVHADLLRRIECPEVEE
jgi:hypothetical protein